MTVTNKEQKIRCSICLGGKTIVVGKIIAPLEMFLNNPPKESTPSNYMIMECFKCEGTGQETAK